MSHDIGAAGEFTGCSCLFTGCSCLLAACTQAVQQQRKGQLDDLVLCIDPHWAQVARPYGHQTRVFVQDQSEDGGKDGTFQSTVILAGHFCVPRATRARPIPIQNHAVVQMSMGMITTTGWLIWQE
jgi:hypothetical protein